jgi:dolichol-phosphate mannosyltransferase
MVPDERLLTDYRRLLEQGGADRSVEIVLAGAEADLASAERLDGAIAPGGGGVRFVRAEPGDWDELARAGLDVAAGDYLLVVDLRRHYRTEALLAVLAPVLDGRSDLAVAVPPRGRFHRLDPPIVESGLVSRLVLGSSDVFSSLFALRRSLWERGGRTLRASGSSLVLELLLRRPARCADVAVPVDPRFRRQRFQLRDLRPFKRVLDGRYGSLSRLIQFCGVGASGMVVDLAYYALFPWLLAFTWLGAARSARFGFSWHLAIAEAPSIAIALLWNFGLNQGKITSTIAPMNHLIRIFKNQNATS